MGTNMIQGELLPISFSCLDSQSGLVNATFSISSLGNIGGGFFTPIINPPEVGILGLSKTYQKPYLSSSKSLKEKEVLPVSLSYDHRLINGVYGAQFVTSLDAILQDAKLFEKI